MAIPQSATPIAFSFAGPSTASGRACGPSRNATREEALPGQFCTSRFLPRARRQSVAAQQAHLHRHLRLHHRSRSALRQQVDRCCSAPRLLSRQQLRIVGHCRYLERQRRPGRQRGAGIDHFCRSLHRARRPASARDGTSHGHEPCRLHKVRQRQPGNHERHHTELGAEFRQRGARRIADISSHGYERWTS
jgi:hypothetical protein